MTRRAERRRDERGAVAIFTAAILVVVVGMAAFVVDIGLQRVARRDMQALSDSVALDLSRLLDGRNAADVTAGAASATMQPLATALASSVARNKTTTVGNAADLAVTPYLVVLNADGSYPTQASGLPTTIAPASVPTGVVVVSSTAVNFAFAGVFGFKRGPTSRTAVGVAQQSACFDLGSIAASISSGGSTLLAPLNGLLGLNLGLITYQGLAGANVSLGELVATGQVGSIDQVLNGTVTIAQLEAATLQALQNNGASTAAITALNQLISASASLGSVALGTLLSVAPNDGAALSAQLNVLNLLSGSILAASGSHAVDISSLNIAGITGGVYVTQGTQRGCGAVNSPRAVATTSQIAANLTVPLSFPTGTSVLGLTVTGGATVSGGIGNARGQLVGPPAITCQEGTTLKPDSYRVDVNGGLLGLGVQAQLTLNGTVATGLLGGLLDSLLGSIVQVSFNNVKVSLGTAAPGTSGLTQHADLKVPLNSSNTTPVGTPVKTGTLYGGQGAVPTITTATALSGSITVKTGGIPLLGIPGTTTTVGLDYGPIGSLVNTLLGTVNGVLNTTVNGVLVPTLNTLLTPLSTLLGLNVGGADVYSVYRPTCVGANLIG